MRKILTIIAAFVFGIQALMSIIDIFTIPTAGNIFLYVIDIEFTVFHIVFFYSRTVPFNRSFASIQKSCRNILRKHGGKTGAELKAEGK